jgi:hypothetical protein
MELAAQNLTSVTSHHLRNHLFKNNMPHNPVYDVCLSIKVMQHSSQQRIRLIIQTLHEHTEKHRSWHNGKHSLYIQALKTMKFAVAVVLHISSIQTLTVSSVF